MSIEVLLEELKLSLDCTTAACTKQTLDFGACLVGPSMLKYQVKPFEKVVNCARQNTERPFALT